MVISTAVIQADGDPSAQQSLGRLADRLRSDHMGHLMAPGLKQKTDAVAYDSDRSPLRNALPTSDLLPMGSSPTPQSR